MRRRPNRRLAVFGLAWCVACSSGDSTSQPAQPPPRPKAYRQADGTYFVTDSQACGDAIAAKRVHREYSSSRGRGCYMPKTDPAFPAYVDIIETP